jgi:hypothetical protein
MVPKNLILHRPLTRSHGLKEVCLMVHGVNVLRRSGEALAGVLQ